MDGIKLLSTLEGHDDRVWSCSWSPDGQILASCGSDKSIRLWKNENNRWSCFEVLVDGHKRSIRSVSWSSCGRMLASASFDGTTCVWRKESGKMESIATLEGHENEVKGVAWANSGFMLATCGRDKSVWIWEVEDDMEDFSCITILNVHSQDVKKIKWHPSEDLLVSCSYDNTLRMYKDDGDDWSSFQMLDSHTSTVWSFDFNEAGDKLASCSDDMTIKIWNKSGDTNSKWICVQTICGHHPQPIYDIAWCKLTDLIATACGDNSIRIFQQQPNSPDSPFDLLYEVLGAHDADVNCVAWNPVVKGTLASCSDSGDVKLWRVTSN